jgi:hypothetical protein
MSIIFEGGELDASDLDYVHGKDGLTVVAADQLQDEAQDLAQEIGYGLAALQRPQIDYHENLWRPLGEREGHGNELAPSLYELLTRWTDVDIAGWALGVALGVFPTDTSFLKVKGGFWGTDHWASPAALSLYRTLRALAGAGILSEDSGVEFCWSSLVHRVT